MQSQMVLQTSERFAILVAENLETNEAREVVRDNIGNVGNIFTTINEIC